MTRENRNAAIAAAVILICFGLLAYFMPVIMLAVGHYSTIAAGLVAIAFVLGFFAIFWLRGLNRKEKR